MPPCSDWRKQTPSYEEENGQLGAREARPSPPGAKPGRIEKSEQKKERVEKLGLRCCADLFLLPQF